jgi:hypothetical protein
MRTTRISQLSESVYNTIFEMLDAEPDMGDGSEAGRVATLVQRTFEAALTDPDPVADTDACPGCGNVPGDGLSQDCWHPHGCGFWKENRNSF